MYNIFKLIIRIIVNVVAILNLMSVSEKIFYDIIKNYTFFNIYIVPAVIVIIIVLLINKLINIFKVLSLTTNYCFFSIISALIILIVWWRIKPDTPGLIINGLEKGINTVINVCILISTLIIWIITHLIHRLMSIV